MMLINKHPIHQLCLINLLYLHDKHEKADFDMNEACHNIYMPSFSIEWGLGEVNTGLPTWEGT